MADKALTNPGGAFGYTDIGDNSYQLIGFYKASAAVVAGNVVFMNTDGTISPAATGTTAGLCIGIAPDAIAAGANGKVVLYGVVDNAVAQGTIAAGDPLIRSATTAAAVLASATAAVGTMVGVAMSASAGGVVTVFVCKA